MLRERRQLRANAHGVRSASARGTAYDDKNAKVLEDGCGEPRELPPSRAQQRRPAINRSNLDRPTVLIETSPMRGSSFHASACSASEAPATRPHPTYPPEQRLDGMAHGSNGSTHVSAVTAVRRSHGQQDYKHRANRYVV